MTRARKGQCSVYGARFSKKIAPQYKTVAFDIRATFEHAVLHSEAIILLIPAAGTFMPFTQYHWHEHLKREKNVVVGQNKRRGWFLNI